MKWLAVFSLASLTLAGCLTSGVKPTPLNEYVFKNVPVRTGMTKAEVLAVIAVKGKPTNAKPYRPAETAAFSAASARWVLRFGTAWHDGGGGMVLRFDQGRVAEIKVSRYR